jgi:L-ascorbate metabolism protein UlaG (beta-lactamase superfamily)
MVASGSKEEFLPNFYYQGPPSDHFDGHRFFHPGLPSGDKSLGEVLRWRWTSQQAQWPATIAARSGLRPAQRTKGLTVTQIGHASLLLQVAGVNLLVDPVWSERVSPLSFLGPRRHNPPSVAFNHLPPIDAVLVTHNHYDHMDVATLARLEQTHHPRFLMPLGNDVILRKSAPGSNIETGDGWHSFVLPGDLRAHIVPAYHWSSRSIRDRRMALWGGFMIESPAGLIYCAGDTGLRDGAIFHEIRRRFEPPALALLPIGAYAPRWFMRNQHADPYEAVQIAAIVGSRHTLGIHWDTFQLTDEQYDEPEQLLSAALAQHVDAVMRFDALHPGDVWIQTQT